MHLTVDIVSTTKASKIVFKWKEETTLLVWDLILYLSVIYWFFRVSHSKCKWEGLWSLREAEKDTELWTLIVTKRAERNRVDLRCPNVRIQQVKGQRVKRSGYSFVLPVSSILFCSGETVWLRLYSDGTGKCFHRDYSK